MSKQIDRLEQLIGRFNYWNNRGKSAICRYILEQLNITEDEFIEHCHGWKERKLIEKDGIFDVIIG